MVPLRLIDQEISSLLPSFSVFNLYYLVAPSHRLELNYFSPLTALSFRASLNSYIK